MKTENNTTKEWISKSKTTRFILFDVAIFSQERQNKKRQRKEEKSFLLICACYCLCCYGDKLKA